MTYATDAPDAHMGYCNSLYRAVGHHYRQIDKNRHPTPTKQGYNFWMNLDTYGGK